MLALLLSAVVGSALACDPRTATCPAIPAMPSSVKYDLTTSNPDFEYVLPAGISSPSTGTLAFTLNKQGDAPTLVTNDYLLYGNVKATIQTAPGVGMVSAFILMSENQDEIDLEWLGAYNNQVQTNYFYEGITANYDRGGVSPVTTPQDVSHVYEIDWTETTLKWLIDGNVIRTLNKADTANYGYPSTPCQIKIGVWASGDPTNPAGTIEWGGGLLDYSKAPYTMTLSSLSVTSYTNAKSFTYASDGKSVSLSQDEVAGNSSSTSSASTSTATMAGGVIQDNIKVNSLSAVASGGAASTAASGRVAFSTGTSSQSSTSAAGAAAAAAATGSRTMSTQRSAAQQASSAANNANTTTANDGSSLAPWTPVGALALAAAILL